MSAPRRGTRRGGDARPSARRKSCRRLIIDVILVIPLDLDRINEVIGGPARHHPHDAEHVRRLVADDADGQLVAGDVLFQEDRLPVFAAQVVDDGGQLAGRADEALLADALARAFPRRLGDERKQQPAGRDVAERLVRLQGVAAGNGDAGGGDDRLAMSLSRSRPSSADRIR